MSPARWTVVVVVPAHDEAEHIEACLRSVLDARLPSACTRFVEVVADRCGDDTAARARRVLGASGSVTEVDVGNVGAARRLGTAAALARAAAAGARPGRTWLLSTDADSTVPAGWIEAHLALAEVGALAVAGTVAVASFDGHPPQVPNRFAERYVVADDGSHGHVHGANLGLRGDAYERAGGWHDLVTAEDHDLWDRLHALGESMVSTSASPVVTSGRATGRAPDGFASLLVDLGRGVWRQHPPRPTRIDRPSDDETMEASA